MEGFVLSCHARRLSNHTIADYSNTLRKQIRFIGDIDVSSITKNNLREFLASQKVSNKTLQNYHTGLTAFFRWCDKEAVIHENPIQGIERLKAEQKLIQPIPKEYVQAMLSVVGQTKYMRNGVTESNQ